MKYILSHYWNNFFSIVVVFTRAKNNWGTYKIYAMFLRVFAFSSSIKNISYKSNSYRRSIILSKRVVFIIDLRKLTFNEKNCLQQSNHDKRKLFFGGGVNILKHLTKGMRYLQLVDYPPPSPQQKQKSSKLKVKQTSKSQD